MTKKTNEQTACNNWEKIGILKGRKDKEKEIFEMIDKHIEECEPHDCCGDEIKQEIKGEGNEKK